MTEQPSDYLKENKCIFHRSMGSQSQNSRLYHPFYRGFCSIICSKRVSWRDQIEHSCPFAPQRNTTDFFRKLMERQIQVFGYLIGNGTSPADVINPCADQQLKNNSSPSSSMPDSIASCLIDTSVSDVELISIVSPNASSSSHQTRKQTVTSSSSSECETSSTSTSINKPDASSRRKYLASWESRPDAMYKTFISDESGQLIEKFLPWLYTQNNAMRCSLCEKYGKKLNANGRLERSRI